MKLKHLTILIAAPALVACSGGSNDFVAPPTGVVIIPPPPIPTPPTPPPTTGELIDSFGAGFATAFRADAQGQPSDPVTGDVIAIDKTTDPFDIPNP